MVVTIHFIHFLFDHFQSCISVICEALKHTAVHLSHTLLYVARVLFNCALDVSEKCHELLFNMICACARARVIACSCTWYIVRTKIICIFLGLGCVLQLNV